MATSKTFPDDMKVIGSLGEWYPHNLEEIVAVLLILNTWALFLTNINESCCFPSAWFDEERTFPMQMLGHELPLSLTRPWCDFRWTPASRRFWWSRWCSCFPDWSYQILAGWRGLGRPSDATAPRCWGNRDGWGSQETESVRCNWAWHAPKTAKTLKQNQQ